MSYFITRYGRQVILAIILAIQMKVLGNMSPHFLDMRNLLDLSTHLAETGIIAIGMTFIIMTGGIDLSVGSLLAVCGIVFGYTAKSHGIAAGVVAALGAGLVGGLLNGALVAWARLPALVVTLGTMALYRGVAMVISQGAPVSGFPKEFAWLGRGEVGMVPVQLIIWCALAVVGMVIADRSRAGRTVIAVGDNPLAARYAALPERSITLALYVGTGLLVAIAGLIYTARVSTAKADAGMGLELEVITAVVLGGTAITGGRGTVLGTFIGVLILGLLRSGLSLAGVATVYQTILSGAILIVVSIINQRVLEREVRGGRRKPAAVSTSERESAAS